MVSLVDALILTNSEQGDLSDSQTSRLQGAWVEPDILFVYEHAPTWIGRVINRLESRGWRVLLTMPGDTALPQSIITITSHSAILKTHNHDTLYCVLPDQIEPEPKDTPHTSIPEPQDETALIHKITQMVEHLISTGYILKGVQGDPRLERSIIELNSTFNSLTEKSNSIADNHEQTHVLSSYDVMSQVCDLISYAFNAELAYGVHQPQRALIMYIELHQNLCNYLISSYLSSSLQSQFWYNVCVYILTSPHNPSTTAPPDHFEMINAEKHWTSRGIVNNLPMTEDELIRGQTKYIQDLENFKQAIMFYDQQAPQITQLINSYRSFWEHLLIARHTAQACCTLSQLIETISEHHWGEHEVVHILVNTERSIAPVVQSGYLGGALSIYAHVIDQLVKNLHALYDPQMIASLVLMDALLKRNPSSSQQGVIDIFEQVKSEIERLIKAYQGQDLEDLLEVSQTKIN